MRAFASCLVLAAAVQLCAACGGDEPADPAAASSDAQVKPNRVNPANVDRVRGELPDGYEVAGLQGRTAPLALWGYGQDWVSDPPQCGALAVPAEEGATVRGWSGSGSGGIVYVAVADKPVQQDSVLLNECGTWSLSAGHTSGAVTLDASPNLDGATTLGMSSEATTRVEGGTETRSHADTFIAFVDEYVTYVVVVTDPGGAGPVLDRDFAAGLLAKTVSTLRG